MTDRAREIAEQVAQIRAENARLLERLADSERRFRRISRGVLRMQEEERARVSRDLHDGIGQSLTALKIQLALLEQEAGREDSELSPRIASARELAESCLSEVRQLAHLLRPQMLDELGLVPTLRWLVRTMRQRTGIDVILECNGFEERLDPDRETLLYRISQEALTNVARHAGAPSAVVRLEKRGGRLLLRIEDQGAGFDANAVLTAGDEDRGFGVRAMRDRVHFFHGRFAIRSAPGKGTTVEADIPVAAGEE
jgi:two-component system, NarL family, sensor kinase